jgi:VanZ family protein
MPDDRPRARDLLLAVAAGALLVLLAPAVGEFRRWLRLSFPGDFVTIVAAGTAVAGAAALAIAVWRIRDRRPVRFGAIALAVALAVVYSWRSSLSNPESDVVEHVHFIEYGLVTWLFYRAWKPLDDASTLVLAMMAALTVGTCEEWFEWFVPARVGELRDIVLNGAAIASGALFSWALEPVSARRVFRSARSRRHLFMVAAIAVAALAVFVDTVHIGHEIRDAEGRTFRSIYTAGDLMTLSAVRQQEWATHPPLERPARFSREDQYASEGLLHVQERNNLWAQHEFSRSLNENRLLEEYFAPVLDAPSYVSRTGHRWPPAQRAEAERQSPGAASDAVHFVSHAQGEFPIFTWSRRWFRAGSAVVVIVLVATAFVAGRSLDYPVPQGAHE